MSEFPTGTISMLLTDIEGSTRLLLRLGERYPAVLAEHRALLRAAFAAHDGCEVDTQGDAFFVVFERTRDAVAAAADAQRALAEHVWPEGGPVRVRMGIHTGEPQRTAEGYAGLDLHRAARIAAAAHGGQVLLSASSVALLADARGDPLHAKDLGLHYLKDLPQPEHLFQLVAADLPEEFPPIRSLGHRAGNLPSELSSLAGRGRELAQIEALLQGDWGRLVTLTGPGGAGKTRLALEAGHRMQSTVRDGVWLVELANLDDPDLVPHAVAQTLSVREQAGRSVTESLIDYLRDRELLVVLDNCEHMIAACAGLADVLMRQCPHLLLLATSRERLNLAGETVLHVPSLSLPEVQSSISVDQAQSAEAVQLFIARAAAVRPGFALTPANAGTVAAICRNLDGSPLAIELAAARMQVLTVEQIEARLADRFRLLTRGSRGVAPRQQTLRATLDWSYELLSSSERLLLSRLAIFVGDWDMEAAEGIAAFEPIEELDLLDLLSALVDKSLVVVDSPDVARFRLLQSVREYAAEKLHDLAEDTVLGARHRDNFLQRAMMTAAHLRGPDEARRLAALEQDLDNYRAALRHSLDPGEAEAALCLAGALGRLWEVRGYLREGRDWLGRALALDGGTAAARAKALLAAGILANRQGEPAESRMLLEQARSLFLGLDQPSDQALTLLFLGNAADYQQEYDQATMYYAESQALYRAAADERGVAATFNGLGLVATNQGHYADAIVKFTQSLSRYQALANQQGATFAMFNLGVVALNTNDHAQAAVRFEACLAAFRDLGDRKMTAMSQLVLARVLPNKAAERRAELSAQALRSFHEIGDSLGVLLCLESIARWALERGEAVRATRLFGAAAAVRRSIHVPVPPNERANYEQGLVEARTRAGSETYAAAWTEGELMPIAAAVSAALAGEAVGT